jgi:transcriptional regulator with XRE-family HTH domain
MLVTRTVEEMEVDLGEKLKRVRLNKNLDQKTLAARSGVSVRALRNLEGGAGTTVKTLLSVVRALGRETWLETVAPVATVNPLTLTARAEQRLRATGRRTTSKKPSSHVSSTQRAMLPASVPNVQSPKESVENPGAS